MGASVNELNGPLGEVGQGVGELAGGMGELDSSLSTTGENMEGLVGSTDSLNGSISETGGFITEASGSMEELSTSTENTTTTLGDMSTEMETTNTGLTDMGTNLETTNTTLADTGVALEDTNTLLTDTGVALEDTNTQLTDTNTTLGDTAGAAEDAQAGFAPLAEEMENTSTASEGVNTGFDKVGKSAGTLDTTNKGLNTSFANLGAGITGITGSAVGMFNAWDNIGDAEVAVDAATLKLDRSMTMLDSRMLGLSKTTEKMNTDSSLMITGLDEWNVAQEALNTLVAQGVTSGSEWDAALQRATTAQQNMTSSTTEGNQVIQEAGIGLEKVSQAADRVAINQNAVDNANEALNQSWVQLAGTVGTMTAGIASASMAFGSLKDIKGQVLGVAGKLKTSISDLAGSSGMLALAGGSSKLATVMAVLVPVLVTAGAALLVINELTKALNIENQKTVISFEDANKAVSGFNETMRGWISQIPGIGPLIAGVNKNLETQINDLTGVTAATDKDVKSKGDLQTKLQEILKPLDDLTGGMFSQTSSFDAARERTTLLKGSYDDLGVGMGIIAGGAAIAENAIIRQADGTIVLKSANEQAKITMDEEALAMEGVETAATNVVTVGSLMTTMTENLTNAQNTATLGLNKWASELITSKAVEEESIKILEDWAAKYGIEIPDSVDRTTKAYQEYIEQQMGVTDATKKSADASKLKFEALLTEEEAMQQVNAEMSNLAVSEANELELAKKWLDAHGVEIPKAIENNSTAIIAFKDNLAGQGDVMADNVAKATDYIMAHGDMKNVVDGSNEGIIAYAKSLGFEAEATKDVVKEMTPFEAKLKILVEEGNKAAESAQEQADKEAAAANAYNEALKAVNAKANELGIYNEIVGLSLEDAEKVVDLEEQAQSAYKQTTTKLQELADARGMELAALEENHEVLRQFIETHKLVPPTYEEVQDAVTLLIAAKEEENRQNELTRLSLEQYLVEQEKVPGAVGASLKVLQAYEQALKNMDEAFEVGKASVVAWYGELVTAEEKERGALEALQPVIDALKDEFPGAAQMSSEELMRLSERIAQSGQGWEEYKQKVKAAIDEIAASLEESKNIMLGALGEISSGAFEAGEDWRETVNSWDDDLDGTLAGMVAAVEQAFKTDIPQILAEGAGDADTQLSNIRGYLEELNHETDMSPQRWEASFGELESILDDTNLSAEEKVSKIARLLPGIFDRAMPEFTAAGTEFTEKGKAVLENASQVFFNALGEKDPTEALRGYFNTLPPDIQAQMADVTSVLNDESLTMQEKMTQIAGIFQNAGIEIPPDVLSRLATALDIPVSELDLDANGIKDSLEKIPAGAQSATDAMPAALSGMPLALQATKDAMILVKLEEVWDGYETDLITHGMNLEKIYGGMQLTFATWGSNMASVLFALGQQANTFASSFMSAFSADIKTHLGTATGHFTTFQTKAGASIFTLGQAVNKFASQFMGAAATDVKTHTTAMTNSYATFASQATSKVNSFASAMQSAMNKTKSSADSATKSVKALQSAINSLRDKTVTITQRFVTTGTRYVAHGGAYITSSPINIGPLKASEFGQRELVTVTPLENPSGQSLPGIKDLVNAESMKKSRRIMDSGEDRRTPRRETVMTRELPIIIQVDGREIARVVNRRIFEGSDSLL